MTSLLYERGAAASFLDILLTQPGLRGLWTFGSVDGSGDLLDISGNGRTLTKNGNPTYDAGSNGAYAYGNLDGIGDYWSRADEAGFDILGTESYIANPGLTVLSWVKCGSTSGNAMIVSKYDIPGASRAYRLYRTGSAFAFFLSNNGVANEGVSSASLTVDTSKWQFIVARFIPSTSYDIWYDGTKTTETTTVYSSLHNSTAPLLIGSGNTGGTDDFDGDISTTAVVASALSDDIIEMLFETSRPIYGA